VGGSGKAAAVDVVKIVRQILESNLLFAESSEDVKHVVLLIGGATDRARLERVQQLQTARIGQDVSRRLIRTGVSSLDRPGLCTGTLGTFGRGILLDDRRPS